MNILSFIIPVILIILLKLNICSKMPKKEMKVFSSTKASKTSSLKNCESKTLFPKSK